MLGFIHRWPMSVRAYFSEDSRLLFNELSSLRDARRLWVRYHLDPEGLEVTDINTNKCSRIALDGASFFFRLNLGSDPNEYNWKKIVHPIVDLFRVIYDKLDQARRRIRPELDCSCQFVPRKRVREMAGRIAMSLLYFPFDHIRAKDADLPVGFYTFSDGTTENTAVYINFKRFDILGEGDTRVYKKCFELMSGRILAKGTVNTDPEDAEKEAHVLELLSGREGLVRTYRSCINRSGRFVVFQDVHPESLKEVIFQDPRRLSEKDKLAIVKGLLAGLTEIAAIGVHFDIAAKNILLNGVVPSITDFGNFHLLGEAVDLDFSEVPLIAPEMLKGKYTSKYDVWKMGIVFYELFTGESPPWNELIGGPRDAMLAELRSGWLKMGEEMPPFMAELIRKMVEPDDEKRFSAQEALDFFTQSELSG